jgi:hypothetical protein
MSTPAFFVICTAALLSETQASTQVDVISSLKKYADTLDAYYLEPVLRNSAQHVPQADLRTLEYHQFLRFMEHLDSLTTSDIEACAAFLCRTSAASTEKPFEKPSARHTTLLLTSLFHSMERRHLPVIAEYLNDDRIVFDYPKGSPETRRIWQTAHPWPRASRREAVRVQDIARHFLRMWGFRAVHITIHEVNGDPVPYVDPGDFTAFWRHEDNVPGPATALWVRAFRARHRSTGEQDWDRIAELQRELHALSELEQFAVVCGALWPHWLSPPDERPQLDLVKLFGHFPKELAVSILQRDETVPLLPNHGDLVALFPYEAEALRSGLIDATKSRFQTLFKLYPNHRFFLAFRVLDFDGGSTWGGYRPNFLGVRRSYYLNVVSWIIGRRSDLFSDDEFAEIIERANEPSRGIWARIEARMKNER